MTLQLIPCPFCPDGGQAAIQAHGFGNYSGCCLNCGTQNQQTRGVDAAVETWNRRADLCSAADAGDAREEYAWLVEFQNGSNLVYRYVENNLWGWTKDPHKAHRYCDKETAQSVALELGGKDDLIRAVEHCFEQRTAAVTDEAKRAALESFEDFLRSIGNLARIAKFPWDGREERPWVKTIRDLLQPQKEIK